MNGIVRGYWADAYYNGDFICVKTRSGYRGGTEGGDPKGKQYLLPPDASDIALGAAVLDAMAHSRFVLPAPRTDVWIHPEVEFDMELYDYKKSIERYAAWTKALMERYGYKTKRALFKQMKLCGIDSKNGVVDIRPSYHEKLEGWSGDGITEEDHVKLAANSSAAEIGAALRLAFSRCT